MPIYEYACKACDHEFEREQRITDAPIKTCPACGARQAKRLISRTSFVLKGGGWYSDLYASGKADAKAGDKADAGGDKKPADKGEGGDTKPKKKSKKKSGGGSSSDGSGKGGKGAKAAA